MNANKGAIQLKCRYKPIKKFYYFGSDEPQMLLKCSKGHVFAAPYPAKKGVFCNVCKMGTATCLPSSKNTWVDNNSLIRFTCFARSCKKQFYTMLNSEIGKKCNHRWEKDIDIFPVFQALRVLETFFQLRFCDAMFVEINNAEFYVPFVAYNRQLKLALLFMPLVSSECEKHLDGIKTICKEKEILIIEIKNILTLNQMAHYLMGILFKDSPEKEKRIAGLLKKIKGYNDKRMLFPDI